MKYLLLIFLLLSTLTPAIAELSEADLNKIRLLIHEELKPVKTEIQSVRDELKTEIQSVKIDVAKLDGRLDGIEKFITWLIAAIVIVFGASQVVILWRNHKEDKTLKKQVEILQDEMEALKQRIQNL